MSSGSNTLDAVRAAIIGAGIGQTDSKQPWAVFVWSMPDGPPTVDEALCLYETPGGSPDPAWAIVYPGVQVVARGKPNETAAVRQKLQDVFTLLHGLDQQLSDQFVYFYAKQSAPISMGIDENKRLTMAWNFRSERNTPA